MTKVIEVVYEDGVFKPLERVDLKEGEKLIIRIEKQGLYETIKKYRKYFEDIDEDLSEILIGERR